eukprot:TRINITY_DN3563_c0_g1_i4.p1 TRINITY_DN3563_c0_g1~~TRINITY_DN3563_c0_g1_i4.p1  ORF type:complete len:1670 (+),score=301.84 TRINITY_DN3563_c0_g1_i4:113-5122(+)
MQRDSVADKAAQQHTRLRLPPLPHQQTTTTTSSTAHTQANPSLQSGDAIEDIRSHPRISDQDPSLDNPPDNPLDHPPESNRSRHSSAALNTDRAADALIQQNLSLSIPQSVQTDLLPAEPGLQNNAEDPALEHVFPSDNQSPSLEMPPQSPAMLQLGLAAAFSPKTSDNRIPGVNHFADLVAKMETEQILQLKELEDKSLGLFTHQNLFRVACRKIATNRYFDLLTITAIVLNFVLLASLDPTQPRDSERNQYVAQAEYFFIVVFTFEMLVKVVNQGFIRGRRAYLRDKWNWIDFIVVVFGLLSLHPSINNYSAIRTIRVLRPLRSLTRFRRLRIIIDSLLQSGPSLLNVLSICMFIFSFFGILGMEIFSGALRRRCRNIESGALEDEAFMCGNAWGSRVCPSGWECVRDAPNPDFGFTSFDNFGATLLIMFRVMSLDDWSSVMYQVMDATGYASALYFILLIMVTTYFMINLALAVISSSFDTFKKAEQDTASTSDDTQLLSLGSSEIMPPWNQNPIVLRLHQIVHHSIFTSLITTSILLNAVVLAIETPSISPQAQRQLETANTAFTYIFLTELVLKVGALGFRAYFSEKFNAFDAFITIISVVELAFVGGGYVTTLRLLRLVRVTRILKAFKAFDSLRMLAYTVVKSLAAVVNLVFVLLIFMSVFSLLGMEFFGGKLDRKEYRTNFDSYPIAMISVFQVLTAEGWSDLMYGCMKSTSIFAAVYFILLLVFGNYVVFYLFLAILINTFSSLSDNLRQMSRSTISITSYIGRIKSAVKRKLFPGSSISPIETAIPSHLRSPVSRCATTHSLVSKGDNPLTDLDADLDQDASSQSKIQASSSDNQISGDMGTSLPRKGRHVQRNRKKEEITGNAFGVFSAKSRFRKLCHKIVCHRYFDSTMLVFIIISSLSLALYTPSLDPNSLLGRVLDIMNIVFTAIFLVEMLLKLIAFECIFGKSAYFQDAWNILDAMVVFISLLSLFATSGNLSSLRVLRTFRAVRPLRLLNRNQGLKIIINAIILSLPSIFNVIAVSLLFWIMFAILGVQLFGGQFHACNDEVGHRFECTGIYIDGDQIAFRQWESQFVNFDDFPSAMQALFAIATFDDWLSLMFSGVDATGIDKQPQFNNRPQMILYFVLFIIFGAFFMVNLFVSVVVDNFHQLQKEYHGHGLLTDNQRQWIDAQKIILQIKPNRHYKRPDHPLRRFCYRLLMKPSFEMVIATVIGLNVLVMACNHEDQSESWARALGSLDLIFVLIFLLEALVKILAVGRAYFFEVGNIFDLVVACLSVLDPILLLSPHGASFDLSVVRVFRIFRVFRVLRLVQSTKSLYKLFRTLVYSLPSLVNVAGLLLLVLFVFSIVGMSVFGEVAHVGFGINTHANFETFFRAIITLFRIMTFDNWSEIHEGCSVQPPLCSQDLGNCGEPQVATIFFIFFGIFASFVILNIYVAVILENFQTASLEDSALIKEEHIERFCQIWTSMAFASDPSLISTDKLEKLLRIIGPPLGANGPKKEMLQMMGELNIPDHEGSVHFLEVLVALTKRVYGAYDLPESRLRRDLQRMCQRAFPDLQKLKSSEVTASHAMAALLIQRRFRRWKRARGAKINSDGGSYSARSALPATPRTDAVQEKQPQSPTNPQVSNLLTSAMIDNSPARAIEGEQEMRMVSPEQEISS